MLKVVWCLGLVAIICCGVSAGERLADDDVLFLARPLTAPQSFTAGIEGPACDRDGILYAVNFGAQQTIGRVTADGKADLYVTLPGKSVGNGIRFDRGGFAYVADYTEHNVLKIDPRTRKVSVFAHLPQMHQPNDLAITSDGILYVSDPDWPAGEGQLWRIDRDGAAKQVASDLGTTNGIEVSPDGRTLYVNETNQRNVWAFRITESGDLTDKRLLIRFPDHVLDGMRCDVDGNLFITRHGKGTVAVLSPQGEILREIDVLGARPTNLCFGGKDGRTVYVTEAEHQRIVQFRVDRPGLEWQLLQTR